MPYKLIFLHLFLFSHSIWSFGNNPEYPIDPWVKALSVREDIRTEKYRQIYAQVLALDSADRCEAIKLLQERIPSGNERYKIRATLLSFQVSENQTYCSDILLTEESLTLCLRTAYELEDDLLLYELHSFLSAVYFKKPDYGRVILHGRLAKDILNKIGQDHFYVWSPYLYVLAYGLYNAREYRECIDLSLQIVEPTPGEEMYNDSLQHNYAMNSWNMLGLCYAKINQSDSALAPYDRALTLGKQINNSFWIALVNGNKGDLFYQLGQYDTARTLLLQDVDQSIIQGEVGNAANSLQWVARIDLHQGQTAKAYHELNRAKSMVSRLYKPEFMANVLYALSMVHSKMGNADSVEFILNRYLTLHDSIEHVASEARSAVIELQLQNLDNVHTIKEIE